jgi:hypothetical protein
VENDDSIAETLLLREQRATRQLDIPSVGADGEYGSLGSRVHRDAQQERCDHCSYIHDLALRQ